MKHIIAIFCSLFLLSSVSRAELPACYDKKEKMDFNESHVLNWAEFMEPKFKARAFVQGVIVQVLEDRQKHIHFEVDFDKDLGTADDRMEVIYNIDFGPVPEFNPGDTLVACGDFVADPYSPTKGVVHWLHVSPKKAAHEDGYLAINGTVTGQVSKKKQRP